MTTTTEKRKLTYADLAAYEINDDSLYAAAIEELREQGTSIPTTLLTLYVTKRIVGADRYSEGSLVSASKLRRLMLRGEVAGIVKRDDSMRSFGKREVYWMHTGAYAKQHREKEAARAKSRADHEETERLRGLYEQAGIKLHAWSGSQVTLGKPDATRLIEEYLRLKAEIE